MANKFEQLKIIVSGNVDILVIIETKIDDTFPTSQFLIEGYSKPYRLDRNRYAGGILIFIRDDIPSKLLSRHNFSHDIEGIFVEINLRKEKLLLFGTYHPPSQSDLYYFEQIGQSLDIYNRGYNKIILAGDFNAEDSEKCLSSFLFEYGSNNPSSIDLFLTNAPNSFQNTVTITCGLSDYHKMILKVLKTTFPKVKPKEILYRNYKFFDKITFESEVKNKFTNNNSLDYVSFEKKRH